METLKKKYGLFTAICMVVGIVIGSGIFFKAEDVLKEAGNGFISIIAWIISGFIMVIIATTFAVMATKYEKVNGAVDYAEAMCGRRYAYYVGWFMSLIYYPAMTAVLAWVTSWYTLVVFGYVEAPLFYLNDAGEIVYTLKSALNSPECITLALFYLILAYFVNTLAPRIAGKFQISSTVVKLVPIAFIAIVGTVVGLANGDLASNLTSSVLDSTQTEISGNPGLFPAICTTIFAYEGWIVATSINSEIKNSKKNLPRALCIGTLIIVTAYTLYNLGILGLANAGDVVNNGISKVFETRFNVVGAAIINVLIVISCMGTLNGLMMGCTRGLYSLASRGEGVAPETISQVDKKTNMPHNSAIFSLMMCAGWFVYFILLGAGLFKYSPLGLTMSEYSFDSSELPIITLYAMYIPMLITMMIKEKELNPFKRFVLPILSLCGIGVIIYACIDKHGSSIIWYLIVFAVIMLIGFGVDMYNRKKAKTA